MLCSLPARAHPPSVAGRKWTFAAARMSAASANVIQSDGLVGIAQTPSPDAAEELSGLRFPLVDLSPPRGPFGGAASPFESVAVESFSPGSRVSPLGASAGVVPSSDLEPARVRLLRRSFLAQPEPL